MRRGMILLTPLTLARLATLAASEATDAARSRAAGVSDTPARDTPVCAWGAPACADDADAATARRGDVGADEASDGQSVGEDMLSPEESLRRRDVPPAARPPGEDEESRRDVPAADATDLVDATADMQRTCSFKRCVFVFPGRASSMGGSGCLWKLTFEAGLGS